MSQPLPEGDFHWISKEQFLKERQAEYLNDYSYFVEADLTYPGSLTLMCLIFDEELIAIETRKTHLLLDKPIYTGATVLDLSKMIMLEFQNDLIKHKYGKKDTLLMTDTEPFVYEIHTDDIYSELYQRRELFDLSDYPSHHLIHCNDNKKVLEKFKDETFRVPIKEFIGLRSKMYCITRDDDILMKKAKGVKKPVTAQVATHQHYTQSLQGHLQ